jgi:hypothetical protein
VKPIGSIYVPTAGFEDNIIIITGYHHHASGDGANTSPNMSWAAISMPPDEARPSIKPQPVSKKLKHYPDDQLLMVKS